MKKIAMICEADSIWIRKYIENVLLGKYDISLFTHSNQTNAVFFQENNVTVYAADDCNVFRGVRGLSFLAKLRYLSKRLYEPFDIIQIHFMDIFKTLLLRRLLRKNKQARTIITYWGSDLYRRNSNELRFMKIILGKIDVFTFVTKALQAKFESIYGEKDGKEIVVDFGVSAYDTISQEEGSVEELKKYWGFPADKIVVMIGYNAIQEQNHLKVIDSLKMVPQEIKDTCHIALQFSYGVRDREYVQTVQEAVGESGYTHSIIWDFLDDRKIAKLRLATDVMIHAQTTDALSASILEILYAGGILINGSWLEYQELDEADIDYIEFQDFSQLRDKFVDVVRDFDDLKRDGMSNRKKLHDLGSWEAVREKWIDVLENGEMASYERR